MKMICLKPSKFVFVCALCVTVGYMIGMLIGVL